MVQKKKEKLYQKVEKFVQEIMDVRAKRLNSVHNKSIDEEDLNKEDFVSINLEQRKKIGGFNGVVMSKVRTMTGGVVLSPIPTIKGLKDEIAKKCKIPRIKEPIYNSASKNDIGGYPDGTKGEIVLNIGCELRVIYNVDKQEIRFRYIDLDKEGNTWHNCIPMALSGDKNITQDTVGMIFENIKHMQQQQKNSIIYKGRQETRQERLKNILNNDHLLEMVNQYNYKKRIFKKYRSKVAEMRDKRRKDLLSKYVDKKNETQKTFNEKRILHTWYDQTNENKFCGLDCGCLKSNGQLCGCF